MTDMHNTYSAENIQILTGLEPVRLRPGMYIGSTGPDGLHHLVYEVVDNSIDEALAGHCSRITVTILPHNIVRVRDDGRGIPVDVHPEEGISALEVVMTRLHAGGKFDKATYKVSGGLHGVGVSVVNALSEYCEVSVDLGGRRYRQRYHRGVAETPVAIVGETTTTGTQVEFRPDAEIFDTTVFSFDTLSQRLRELAFLNKGLTIVISDQRGESERSHEFRFDGGVEEFVRYLNKNKKPIQPQPVYFEAARDNVEMEVAIEFFRQQYQHPRGRHPSKRVSRCLDAHAQRVPQTEQAREKAGRLVEWGRRTRGPYRRRLGQGHEPPVRGTDQGQAR